MTLDPEIGVIFRRDAHPSARSLADLLDPEKLRTVLCDEHLPLSEVLAREWAEDAHLLLYSLFDEDSNQVFARAKKKGSSLAAELGARGGKLSVPILVLDYDLPKDVREWTAESLAMFVLALPDLPVPAATYWYSTLHGCRWIYVLTEPITHLESEALAATMIARFDEAGLELDRQCVDWTRLFRLPRTVRADTGLPFHEDQRFVLIDGGPTLDPRSLLANAVTPKESVGVAVETYQADMPDPDAVRELLVVRGDSGRERPSDWVKNARTYLQGRESYGPCFEHAKVDVSGGWNNAVTRIVGQVVGMTARLEQASPEGIFALLHGALEQLQADEDAKGGQTNWLAKGWDIVCRMWSNEQAQVELDLREREIQVAEAGELRDGLLVQLRAAHPELVPEDESEAQAWFRRQMVASDGSRHYVMRRDGSYNIRGITDSLLVPMIQELGMQDVIETHALRGKAWVARSTTDILNDHATPITAIRCSSREKVARVEGAAGYKRLHVPVHKLNPLVKARYDPEVDAWLRKFFGPAYPIGIEWLSWCLDVSGPICALNLYGSPGTGKGMLVQGIAECFEGEHLNDGKVLGRFNIGLLSSPVVNCDEGVPRLSVEGCNTADQAFRTLISGGNLVIEGKGTNPINADIYPRIIFTANNKDIIRGIVGTRDLTDDDIRAIEVRLLSINLSDDAVVHLTAHGNYEHTAGWIHGREKSRYILASHIMHLFENRKTSKSGTGRLLVEGEMQAPIVRSMRLQSSTAQSVMRALIKMIESTQHCRGLHITHDQVLVTPSGIVEYSERALAGLLEKLTLPKVSQVLKQFAIQGKDAKRVTPNGGERGRWIELDLAILLEEALRYGLQCERMEGILRLQKDGPQRITTAQWHARDGVA